MINNKIKRRQQFEKTTTNFFLFFLNLKSPPPPLPRVHFSLFIFLQAMSETDASVAGTEHLTLAKKVLEEIAPEEGGSGAASSATGADDRI